MKNKYQYKNSEFKLTMNEIERMISNAKNMRDRMIVESLYFPALRREEVVNLDIRDIDFDRKRLIIKGKGGKISPIPVGTIYPMYMTNLKFFIGKRTSGPVFTNSKMSSLTLSRINQIIAEIGVRANLKNPNPRLKHINPHMLRHSQARHLKDLGFHTEFIQKYLRHSSYKTTMDTYGTLSLEEMEEQANLKMLGGRVD